MGQKKTIAVVEDNKDNRLLIRALLSEDYKVAEFNTGFSALEGFKKKVPDLIIMDISLPGMDGVELLSHIRTVERLKGVPVIALTAHAMSGDRDHYLSAGFDDYISKPIVEEELLLATIERHMRKSAG